ncbi:XRE family transcriptional regulator [Psychrilyobacter atlanticus]|uniref:XRE family transcriptional regulator n=1 Tax=Psychrilyobacter atlanticus TaxID=271091 RepID=UPI00146EB95D|nr:XRE family transcriptional regulator [Psychrilyobacter atlanticus]
MRIKLGEFLKNKRESKNYGLNQFCMNNNIQTSLYSRLENGKVQKINPYLLKKIARGLKIDYKELYIIVNYLEDGNDIEQKIKTPTIKIPLFESISVGYGFKEGAVLDYIVVPELKNTHLYYAIKLMGNSMEPTIKDRSIIIIKKDESITDGEIGAFIVEGGAVVKRIRRGENENILISDNHSYMPIVIRNEEDYHECGRIVKVITDL